MNQPIETEIDVQAQVNKLLSVEYTLVEFTATSGPRTKTDRKASEATTDNAGAKKGSAKVVKDLFHGASQEVDAIDAAVAAARAVHYQLTAPWVTDGDVKRKTGPRLLANYDLLRDDGYAQQMAQAKKTIVEALVKLEQVYAFRVQQAMSNLGDLAKESDYPSFAEYRAACTLKFRPKPVTTSESWGQSNLLLTNVGNKLVQTTQDDVAAQVNIAIHNTMMRLVKPMERMINATTFNDEKEKYPAFYETVVTNLQDACHAIRSFNLYNDGEINALVSRIEDGLCQYDVEEIRANEGLKAELHDNAIEISDIMSKMAAFQ